MPILHPVLRRTPDTPTTDRYLDNLYDYLHLIGKTAEKRIAMFEGPPPKARVAVVGAGAAGLCAAYELLKIGVVPTILEATDRIGGRAWSRPWPGTGKAGHEVFAEMGSMRVPPVHVLFSTYATRFRMNPTKETTTGGVTTGGFPDPGKVPTLLYYQNQRYEWHANVKNPPGLFDRINNDFNAFINPISQRIYNVWGDWDRVTQEWQRLIDEYRNMSFYEAVVRGIPQWTTEDLNAFGALGVGSGGFGPLFGIGFLEMLRILITEWEVDQQLWQQGMTALEEGFLTDPVDTPGIGRTSLKEQKVLRMNTPVLAVRYDPGSNRPSLLHRAEGGGEANWHPYDAVVLATSTCAMQMIGLTLPERPESGVVGEEERVAVRNLHMTSSSKLFICTEKKFWLGRKEFFPYNIQTDELPRGVYTLNYPQTDHGVVLLSYTWEDDSTRLLSLPVEQRFEKLKEIITAIHPAFGRELVPMPGTDIYEVDWQCEPYYYSAFKLNQPGQEPYNQVANYQFQTVLDPRRDRGVYLAGDGVSWSGGWTEGALQTGLNAACAVAKRLGAEVVPGSPLTQQADRYNYGAFRALGFTDHRKS